MRLARVTLITLIGLTLFSATELAQAQSITASLYGTVLDSGGAVVPGASIRAIHVATGTVYTFVSDGAGGYDFPQLRLGAYRLEAEMTGFRKLVQEGIITEKLNGSIKREQFTFSSF